MHRRWFWLLNLALILLYLWTMTEESTVQVQVDGEECTAIFPEQQDLIRTSTIPCPNLRGGFAGLYSSHAANGNWLDKGPLDWLFPRSGWRAVTFSELGGEGRRLAVRTNDDVPGWRRVWGEWRPLGETAVMNWPAPIYDDYLIAANLRRPDEQAGIMLLEADGENGYVYIADPSRRRGVWWRWQNGELGEPIIGMPYQKPLLAQGQSLLRRILRAHQGALLLVLGAWLMIKLSGRLKGLNPGFKHSFPWPRSWKSSAKYYVLMSAFLFFAATGAIATDVLERIPHVQDSITYLFQAQLLAHGQLWAEAPQSPDFFEQEFLIVDNGRWFGQYSPGFLLILAAGVWLGQPWLVNPMLATMTLILLYLLGKALYRRSAGLIAVVLAIASPFLLFMSGSLMAHPAELFWVTAFMLSWTMALQKERRRWPLLAGLALGMLFLTRQATAVAAALPFLVVMVLGVWQRSKAWAVLVKKTALLLVSAVPLVVLLLLYQNALTGSPFRDPRLLARPFDRIGFGIDIGENPNALRMNQIEDTFIVDWIFDPEQPPRGHTLARGIYNTEQNWRWLEVELFGWLPIFTLAFVWLAFLGGRPSSADFALLAAFGGTVFVYVFYWSDGIMYGPRYYYGALPALLLLTARGIQRAAEWIGGAGKTAVAFLVALLIAGNLFLNMSQAVDKHRAYNFIGGQERAHYLRPRFRCLPKRASARPIP